MSEPTNEELRKACDRMLDIERSVSVSRGTLLHFGTFDLARFALSRLDREAEAERPAVKVTRKRQGGIADCACGETVFESMRYCPGCGKRLDFKEI